LTFTTETYTFVQDSKQGEFVYVRIRSDEKHSKGRNSVRVDATLKTLAPLTEIVSDEVICSNLSTRTIIPGCIIEINRFL